MVPRLGTCFLEDHLAFLSKTGTNTSKKFSLPSLFEGTALSKVGSTLSKALLFTGSDRISIAEVQWQTQRTVTMSSGPSRDNIGADKWSSVTYLSLYRWSSRCLPLKSVLLQLSFCQDGASTQSLCLLRNNRERVWNSYFPATREASHKSRRKTHTHGQLWSVSVWLCISSVWARGQRSDLDSDKQVTGDN